MFMLRALYCTVPHTQTMPSKKCSNCKQIKPGAKLCAGYLLCPKCKADNESKLVKLEAKTKHAALAAGQEPSAPAAESTK